MRAAIFARAVSCALLAASFCSSQVDERCAGTAVEHGPKLLGGLDPLKDTARNQGYDRLVFRLTVTETGNACDPVIAYPPQLAGSAIVKAEILKLRFCPAARYGRYTEVRVEFDIHDRKL